MAVITNPKTGRMETIDDVGPTKEQLEKLRREVRDIIAGNVQFHLDPFAAQQELDLVLIT